MQLTFWTYYVISLIYCIYQMQKRWSTSSNTTASPEMDVLAVIIMAPILMAVDVSMTWIRLYREAEEARRKTPKI